MSFSLTYLISTYFTTIPKIAQLVDEILNAGLSVQLISANSDDINVVLYFNNQPDSNDIIIIQNVCRNHVPLPDSIYPVMVFSNGASTLTAQYPNKNITFFGKQNNEVVIDLLGQGDFTTISAALTQYASTTTGISFIVRPGIYIENNPLVLPKYCDITAVGTAGNTFIVAANPTQNIFNISEWTLISDFLIKGATSATGISFNSSNDGAYSSISKCIIVDCNIGIECYGGQDALLIDRTSIGCQTASMTVGLKVDNSGHAITTELLITGTPTFPLQYGIYVSDNLSTATLVSTTVQYCTTGVYINNSATFSTTILYLNTNNISIDIEGSGTECTFDILTIKNSTTYDVNIGASNASMSFNGTYNIGLVNNPNNLHMFQNVITQISGQNYSTVTGNIDLGSTNDPTTISLGQNHYNVNEPTVMSNTDLTTGTWTNNTSLATGITTNNFNLFSDVSTNNCLYIGDNLPIYGIEVVITTATSSLTPKSSLIWEYWNGSTWTQFNDMVTQTTKPYYTNTNSFISYNYDQHIRFGLTSNNNWASGTFNSITNPYWVRYRIVSNIPSVPIANYIKVHTSSSYYNTDGSREYFGEARGVSSISFSNTYTSSSPPSTSLLYLTPNIGMNINTNTFPASVLSRIGFIYQLNPSIDTSFPLIFEWSFIVTDNSSGNITWIIRWYQANVNSIIDVNTPPSDPGEQSITTTSTIQANSANNQIRTRVSIPINNLNSNPSSGTPDDIWITIERISTDTFPNTAYTTNLMGYYVISSPNAHLLSFY